ncbi:MAG: DUF3143 domain-containing protein [Thermosynechococcaceae cyanobacterium MS004]|jgi:hypothetical protein|nr:DUF3143 domain-containing protein [Thermosynechococcaceae cyanobacterium MS004]
MASSLPKSETPLYNHTLPDLEHWLRDLGCERDSEELHLWHAKYPTWSAEIRLEIEELSILYQNPQDQSSTLRRNFKYSLSRQDVENAIFAGP